MRTKVVLQKGEKIRATFTHGTFFIGHLIARPARITLTNRRIILEPTALSAVLFGIFGALIGRFFKKHVHSLPYQHIATVERARIGLNKNIVHVKMNDNTVYTFGVQNFRRLRYVLSKVKIQYQE